MDYAAIIWHRPNDKTAPSIQQLKKLSSVQRHIMRAITGCFRTTSTAALENETSLQPPKLRLREKILKTITRMQTLPPEHPLHRWIQDSRRNRFRTCPFHRTSKTLQNNSLHTNHQFRRRLFSSNGKVAGKVTGVRSPGSPCPG
jgi:hypothetical protein